MHSILLLLLKRGPDSQIKCHDYILQTTKIMQQIMTDHGVVKRRLAELLELPWRRVYATRGQLWKRFPTHTPTTRGCTEKKKNRYV